MIARPANSEPTFSMDDARFFFQSPPDKPVANAAGQVRHSILAALRGDVAFCMGTDPSNGKLSSTTQSTALWSGTITIMAGIDLLAKFYTGCDVSGKVGERFNTFATKFLGLTNSDADILYRLRNSLVHSYGLSFDVHGFHIDLAFGLDPYQHLIIRSSSNQKIIVDLLKLYRQFEAAIDQYHDAIESDSTQTLQANFARMFQRYGSFFTYMLPGSTMAVEKAEICVQPPTRTLLRPQISTGHI